MEGEGMRSTTTTTTTTTFLLSAPMLRRVPFYALEALHGTLLSRTGVRAVAHVCVAAWGTSKRCLASHVPAEAPESFAMGASDGLGESAPQDPVEMHVTQMALLLSRGDFSGVKSIAQTMQQASLPLTLRGYNILLTASANTREGSLVQQIHQTMLANDVTPDRASFNTIIKAYALSKEIDPHLAFDVYRSMVEEGKIQPDFTTFHFLIMAAARTRNVDHVLAQEEEMRKQHVIMTELLQRRLLRATITCQSAMHAMNRVREMEKNLVIPGLRALYDATLCCIREGAVSDALYGFQRLVTRRPHLDNGLLIELLDMGARLSNAEVVNTVTEYLASNPHPIREHYTLLTSLAAAYACVGEFDKAFRMDDNPTRLTAQRIAIAHACARSSNQVDQAYYKLVEMKRDGDSVQIGHLNTIIKACVELRDVSRAFATFAEVENTFGLRPDATSFTLLLEVCAYSRAASHAIRVFERMRESGVQPTMRALLFYLDCLIRSRNINLATEALLSEEFAHVYSNTYYRVIRMLVHQGRHEKARELVDLMERRGWNVEYIRRFITTEEEGRFKNETTSYDGGENEE